MSRAGVTRARFLAGIGVGGVTAMGGGFALGRASADEGERGDVVAFNGMHQAGITTPQQDHLVLAAFDLTPRRRDTLEVLLKDWTTAASRLTQGQPADRDQDSLLAPPSDTGEAGGLRPARLTLTFGFGPGLFGSDLGLADRRPAQLVDLPPFNGEDLQPARSGGDLCVQACSDDPQVAFHAVRNLIRIARGAANIRWIQQGFLRASTVSDSATPRNLMGFRDGTNNLATSDAGLMRDHVWSASEDGAPWMANGSYLVTRRVRILIENWDRTQLGEQEQLIGRHKVSGAPLGAKTEFEPVAHERLEPTAHVRLASHHAAGRERQRLLRRGYNYADGIDPATGQLDAGLFFLAYQRDPRSQFIPLQQRLASQDGLNEYLLHTASAIFACPPGIGPGGVIGETLFT